MLFSALTPSSVLQLATFADIDAFKPAELMEDAIRIQGGAYDNNLLCIAEKEVFVVASVFDRMLEAMERAGAVRLNAREIETLTKNAIIQVGEGEHKHDAPAKDFLGQDASVLAKGAGKSMGQVASELLAISLRQRDGDRGDAFRFEWVSRDLGRSLVDLEDKEAVRAVLDGPQ